MAGGPIIRTTQPIPTGQQVLPTGGELGPGGGGAGRSGVYIAGNENLLVTTINFASTVVLSVGIRWINERGEVVPVVRSVTLNSAGTVQNQLIKLHGGQGGWIDGIFIIPSSGTPGPTDTYVEAGVVVGDAATRTNQTKLLVSGFTTADVAVSFPVGSALSTNKIFGQGAMNDTGFSGSMVGGITALSFSDGRRTQIRQGYIQINTSAVAGNRFLILQMNNSGGSVSFKRVCKTPQPASTSYIYLLGDVEDDTALIARTASLVNMNISGFLTPETLYTPYNIVVALDGVQAGDACGGVGGTLVYEYWYP